MTFLQIASKVLKENKSFFCHLSKSGFQTILYTNFIDFINIFKMPLKIMLKMLLFTPFYGMSVNLVSLFLGTSLNQCHRQSQRSGWAQAESEEALK